MDEFKDFNLIRKPEVESYTFRGKNFVNQFNITFADGRIYLSGDCGDNVFTVRESIADSKKWLLNRDEGYVLSKGIVKRDHYDKDFARKQINIELLTNGDGEERNEAEVSDIMEKLDFTNIQSLMQTMSEDSENFPDYWEMKHNLVMWSPMAKMQYKQLKFAGEWFIHNEKKETMESKLIRKIIESEGTLHKWQDELVILKKSEAECENHCVDCKPQKSAACEDGDNIIRHDVVMKAVSALLELRKERSKDDDNIVRFSKVFNDASETFAVLNRVEQKEYWKYVVAKDQKI